jgi:hypothetical protein
MKNQFTMKRLIVLGALTAGVFAFIAWQQTTNPPHGGVEFTATRGQFNHYIPHVIVIALIVIAADFLVLWFGWKRYKRERAGEPVTDVADVRLNPLREVDRPVPPSRGAQ